MSGYIGECLGIFSRYFDIHYSDNVWSRIFGKLAVEWYFVSQAFCWS